MKTIVKIARIALWVVYTLVAILLIGVQLKIVPVKQGTSFEEKIMQLIEFSKI